MNMSLKVNYKTIVQIRYLHIYKFTCWGDVYASNIANERQYLRVKDKRHFGWTRQKARALLLWRLGSLRFKGVWKVYNRKHGIESKCVMPQC